MQTKKEYENVHRLFIWYIWHCKYLFGSDSVGPLSTYDKAVDR